MGRSVVAVVVGGGEEAALVGLQQQLVGQHLVGEGTGEVASMQ
jgi:hypothetical protein